MIHRSHCSRRDLKAKAVEGKQGRPHEQQMCHPGAGVDHPTADCAPLDARMHLWQVGACAHIEDLQIRGRHIVPSGECGSRGIPIGLQRDRQRWCGVRDLQQPSSRGQGRAREIQRGRELVRSARPTIEREWTARE